MPHLSLFLTLALAAGLAAGVLLDSSSTRGVALLLGAGWLACVLAFVRGWTRGQLAAAAVTAAAAGCLLGAHAVDRAQHPPLRTLLEQRVGGFGIDSGGEARPGEPIVIEGWLRSDASPTETGVVLRVDVERVWIGPCPEAAAGGVSIGVSGAMQAEHIAAWTAGRRVRAPALLRRPARYLNEGVPDQERAMARRGVTLVGTVKSAALVEVVARGQWWEEAAARVRARTRTAMARHLAPFDAQSAAIATAILIGDRAALDVEIERRLQEAGTYHVIAISGGNIAILAGLVLGGLGWMGIRGRVAALTAIAILASYAIVAGGGASVARATVMAVIYLAIRLIDQRTAAANAVALTGAALLLANPLSMTDVGFWLTFGATSAILVGVARFQRPFLGDSVSPWLVRSAAVWWRAAWLLLLASICAELALAPIGALVFQRVTLAGLALNFVAIPCMTLVQLASMVLVATDVAGAAWLAQRVAWVVHLGARGITDSAHLLDVAPWLAWRVPSPSVYVLVLYYGALVASAFARNVSGASDGATSPAWSRAVAEGGTRRRILRTAPVLIASLSFLWIVAAPAARVRDLGDRRLHLTLIDVGQGDAMLVTFPDGRRLIVDTGGVTIKGEFDVGDRVVGPTLRATDLLRVDYLAVTHGDPDHIGGARALVRDFAPREIWWGVPVANHEPAARLRKEADARRAAWRTLQRGDRLEIAGVELRVHHPPPPDWERQKVRNNDSLVMELRLGQVSILLTGDIGREVEQALLPTLDLPPMVVLKVAHHGSGTSSSAEFVRQLHPAVALIGVGRGNPYGHPVPYVLERYFEAGTQIFRTDQDGQIDLVTDGSSLSVSTFTGRVWSRNE